MQALIDFFGIKELIPHGYCLSWSPLLLWLNVISDLLITLAYYSIPLTLIYFLRRRKDLPYPALVALFAAFIVACGTTHLLSAVTVWIPLYWLDGLFKGITAIISLIAATLMLWVVPRALSLPTIAELQNEIQQRKIAEQALHHANMELQDNIVRTRLLLDSALDGIITMDHDGKIVTWNTQAEHIFGYSREQALGSKVADLIVPPDYREKHQQGLLRFVTTGVSHIIGTRLEVMGLRADTSEFPMELAIDALEIEGRYFFSAFVRDITERKQMENALRESEYRWKFAVEGSGDGLWDWNVAEGTVFFSKRWKEMLGFNEDEVGNSLDEWEKRIHPDDRATTQATVQTYFDGQTPTYHSEHRVKCKDGNWKWILDRGIVVSRDAEGKPLRLIGTHTDITPRKHTEAELTRSNAELEQFAYAASHDMRQPLRMVTSYLSLIESALAGTLTEETQQCLDFAMNGAKRMDAMILSLLDYSRVGRKSEAKTRISSKASLDEALAFLNPELCACAGDLKVSGEWPELFASRDELTRLLQNLIGNALKYHSENQPPQVEIYAAVTAQALRVEVRDQGIGIEPSQMDRLFKVFSRLQARSRFEGTGIGLALCRKIVEHHGGRIGVESAGEGQGCVFWFELPLVGSVHDA